MKKNSIFGKEIYQYAGALHIHTGYSFDASGKVDDIIESAKQCKLDFITINDHLSLDAKKEISKKQYNGIYVLAGYEMNDAKRNNHYLVFQTDAVLPTSLSAQEYVKIVAEDNGYGFIAHPIEKRRTKKLRAYEWDAWDAIEFDGIEIWNFLSEWTDSLILPFNLIFKTLFPNSAIKKPYKEILKKWDEFNIRGLKKSAIGSSDAHGKTYKLGPLSITFLPHKRLLKAIQTHIWLRQELNNNTHYIQILKALKNGNSFIVNVNRGYPDNFYYYIYSGNTKNFALPGEEISLSEKKLYLSVQLPQDCLIKIIFNGKVVHSELTPEISFPITKPGFYRVEVYKGNYGWIYSNPIYVK
ncbi:MAG: PHP domain-containing protein [Candidatus Cloacimonadota bacterium]|nr:PHP domain-containing protein [Candidatus Cloacimonadota bacterium]